jgi:hypothetical protein
MASKVRAAGGASPWAPVASANATLEAVRLLASLACLTADAAGRPLGCHGATAHRRAKLHDLLPKADLLTARQAGMATRAAIDRTFGA